MPPVPHPHSSEDEELVALYALDVLEPSERADFESHLADCPACQTLLAQDRHTLARLGAALEPDMEPSPGFKQRLLQRAAQELRASAAAENC